MAPTGYEVGTAYVQVLPSFRSFQRRTAAEVAKMRDVEIPVKADVDSERARAALAELERPRTVRVDAKDAEKHLQRLGSVLRSSLTEGFRNASRNVDNATDRMAQRMERRLAAIQFAAAFAGLPASATVAVGATAAVLGGVPALFGAVATAAAVQSDEVRQAWRSTWAGIRSDLVSESGPMEDTLVATADKVGAAFDRMEPQIVEGMNASTQAVEHFSDGVLAFAENAMPGAVEAVRQSEPVFEGAAAAMSEVGHGAAEMFSNFSEHSDGAGDSLLVFGGIVRDAEAFLGSFLGALAGQGSPVLRDFRATMQSVYALLNSVATDGFPLLEGAASGAMSVVSGLATVANGFVSVLGGWAQPLGHIGGALWATNSVMGLFGTSIGDTVTGARNLASGVDAAGNRVGTFGQQVGRAEGFLGKVRAGATALTTAGLNPLGVALGAVSLALSLFGREAQEAAERQARFEQGVKDLQGTLNQTTGAITANTRAKVADEFQTEKLGDTTATAADFAREYGISLNEITAAALQGGSSMERLTNRLRENTSAKLEGALSSADWNALQAAGISLSELTSLALGNQASGYRDLDDAIRDTTGAEDAHTQSVNRALKAARGHTVGQRELIQAVRDQRRELEEAQRAMRATSEVTGALGNRLEVSNAAATKMSEALAQVGLDAASAEEEAKALLFTLDLLNGNTIDYSRAQSQFGTALDEVKEALGELTNYGSRAADVLVNAHGGINGMTEGGRQLQSVFDQLLTPALAMASAEFESARNAGKSLADQIDAAEAPVRKARSAFIEAATAMGLSKEQARALADQMGLIPEQVAIQFLAEGDTEVQGRLTDLFNRVREAPKLGISVDSAEVEGLQDKLRALGIQVEELPNGQVSLSLLGGDEALDTLGEIASAVRNAPDGTVTVEALTGDAVATLESLGYQVRELPDGRFEVRADTKPAEGTLDDFYRGYLGELGITPPGGGGAPSGGGAAPASLTIDANTAPARQSGVQLLDWFTGQSATSTGHMDTNPAMSAALALLGWVNASSGTSTGFLDTNPALRAALSLIAWVNGADGTSTGHLDTGPGRTALDRFLGLVDRSRASATAYLDDDPARSTLDRLVSSIAAPVTKVVDIIAQGPAGLLRSVFGATGGFVTPVGILPGYAHGGLHHTGPGKVYGPGTGTSDDVNARLSAGEFVVRERITRQTLPFLLALNAGDPGAVRVAKAAALDPEGVVSAVLSPAEPHPAGYGSFYRGSTAPETVLTPGQSRDARLAATGNRGPLIETLQVSTGGDTSPFAIVSEAMHQVRHASKGVYRS